MRLRWQTPFLALSAIIMMVHTAAVPTQDTLVIAKSDEQSTVSTILEEPTTEEPRPPIKLTDMEVVSEISMRYARTTVETRVRNPAKYAQEATFRLLLPETAFISGFVMTLNGKSYKAYVKEKEEAKKIYTEAVSQGIGAAHIAAKARDSNHFTVSVNVEPNTTAEFNLKYEELLERRNGVYNHAINLHPGVLVPKMNVIVNIKETEKITLLRVPEMRTGNEIDATEQDAQNTNAVIKRGHDERTAKITFTPDLDEQKRLIRVYADKSKESADGTKDGILGQFVVQYDVDRPKGGEVLVNDGYFVHFFAPDDLTPLQKHVVFVLDTSGSMMGRKMEQLLEAMHAILDKLNDGDYFNIVDFDSNVRVQDVERGETKKSKNYWETVDTVELVAPSEVTPENIAKAKAIVSGLEAYGGTNIASALDVAVKLVQKGIEKKKTELKSASTTSATETSTEAAAASTVATTNNNTVAEVDDAPEPIVIFLTDGDPTVGDTDPTRIINHLTEKNYGPKKASIFSLAFGEDADRKFLRKLSLRNAGFMRHIYEAADAALQLRDFYRQVASPLLADLHFVYPKDQIKGDSLTRHQFRTFYAGSETVVAGRAADGVSLTPQVMAFCGNADPGRGRKKFAATPKVVPNASGYLPLERLWAYLTIKQLLDKKDADDVTNKDADNPEKKALDIALKYEFVTPLTSLVVVKPNATNAVNAESVDNDSNDVRDSMMPLSFNSAPSPHAYASYMPVGLSGPMFHPLALDSAVADFEHAEEDDDLLEGDDISPVRHYSAIIPSSFSVSNIVSPESYSAFLMPSSSFRQSAGFINQNIINYYGSSLDWDYNDDYDYMMPRRRLTHHNRPIGLSTLFNVYSTTATPTTVKPSVLEEYHLGGYGWLENLINGNSDSVVLHVNGTEVRLKLTKDHLAPKSDGGDSGCNKTESSTEGLCVYLTRCAGAQHITAAIYENIYCTVADGYAGVCCSKSNVDASPAP